MAYLKKEVMSLNMDFEDETVAWVALVRILETYGGYSVFPLRKKHRCLDLVPSALCRSSVIDFPLEDGSGGQKELRTFDY